MTAAELLTVLRTRGVEVQVVAGRIRYRPRSAVTPELAVVVEQKSDALIALLTPCPTCGGTNWRTVRGPWRCAVGPQHSVNRPCRYRRGPSRLACRTCDPPVVVAIDAVTDTKPVQMTMMALPTGPEGDAA